jgi:hypothetical protein
LEAVNRRLQSSSRLRLGKAMFEAGNQRWGEASSCQRSPLRWRCQGRTAARTFLGRAGVGQMVLERPAADLGAVEFEVVEEAEAALDF